MENMLPQFAKGATAGLAATVPMTLAMEGMHRRLPDPERYPLAPRLITERVAEAAGNGPHLDDPEGTALSLVAHLGLLPALGILTPVTDHPPRRTGLMIAAHLIWGAALGLMTAQAGHPYHRAASDLQPSGRDKAPPSGRTPWPTRPKLRTSPWPARPSRPTAPSRSRASS